MALNPTPKRGNERRERSQEPFSTHPPTPATQRPPLRLRGKTMMVLTHLESQDIA